MCIHKEQVTKDMVIFSVTLSDFIYIEADRGPLDAETFSAKDKAVKLRDVYLETDLATFAWNVLVGGRRVYECLF